MDRKSTAVRLRPHRVRKATPAHRVGIFTAIAGTLLDARTFDAGAAKSTIARLRAEGIPVIPLSVMTLGELEPIAAELGLQQAMVIEAGGAIARWNGERWEIEPCGPPAETMLDVMRDLEDRSGASLIVHSAQPEQLLRVSARRSFTEPFLIERGELASIEKAAGELGFSVRRGRRFYHLCRECDRGEAFARLREELGCEVTIGVGGSMVDAEFLTLADAAIIVPGPDGVADAELVARLPNARIAPAPAPDGWTAAIAEALQNLSGRPASRAG
jgi:mannosyl-3-phosphoglycerate phosphatase